MSVGSTAVTRVGLCLIAAFTLVAARTAQAQQQPCADAKYSDSHFHLTNYVQEGTSVQDYINMMGTTVCRYEPPRVCRRPFHLSHAASFCWLSVA
jgi:hypothetical protein